MKLSHLLFSSFLLVPFHAHAMEEDPYAIAGRYAQQLQVAATAQQTRPTDETLKTYFQAYGASGAASRLLGAGSTKEAYAIAATYANELQAAATAQQTRPTDETLKIYFQAYGASEAASRLLGARGASEIVPVQPVPVYHPHCCNPWPQQSESHGSKNEAKGRNW